MYDLINIFEIFLPQLLLYPNPTDPLNPEAAQMQLKYEEKYKEKIKEYIGKYAQIGDVGDQFNATSGKGSDASPMGISKIKNG